MRLSTEKAIEFVENLEKYHPIQKYWDESNERHRQEKNTENYPYSYFRGVLIRKIAEIIEALQQENEQLRAQVAQVREALRKAREALVECIDALELCTHNELCKIAVSPYDMIRDAKEALAEIDKVIGGKEDV